MITRTKDGEYQRKCEGLGGRSCKLLHCFLHKTIFVVYTHTDTEGSSVYYLPVTMVTLGHVSRQLQTQDLIAILIRIHV
jgi:hypothetical protein